MSPITREIERVGKEQQLIAQACAGYDEDVLVEALSMDALCRVGTWPPDSCAR